MKIVLMYSVITKEGFVYPNISEEFTVLCEDDKQAARDRLEELKNSGFAANVKYRIDERPERRVVKVRFPKSDRVYTYEVDRKVRPQDYVIVPGSDGMPAVTVAVGNDEIVPESSLGFPINRLKKALAVARRAA